VPLRAALGRIEDYALVVFVSPNAVSWTGHPCPGPERPGRSPVAESVPVAVVGPSSVVALAERGIAPPAYRVIAPAGAQGNDTAGDAALRFRGALVRTRHLAGRVCRPQGPDHPGSGGREWLADRLRDAGATVEAVEAYSRTLPEPSGMQWQAVRDSLKPDAPPYAWLLTSSEAVRNLDGLARLHLSPQEHERLKQMQCIAPHARIAAQAQSLGFAHVLPAAPGDAGCWPHARNGASLCWAGHASARPRIACTRSGGRAAGTEPTPAPMAPRNPRQPKSNA
jgi:uroporphyrinogen III methyltransferase/synthase